jgi:sodium-dependent phosphate cotransporter
VSRPSPGPSGRGRSHLGVPALALAALGSFLLGVRLLGTATVAAAPVLSALLRQVVVGDASALGVGWLAAYGLANGSVVAALALSLFESGVLTSGQLFATVAGSRLGGSAVVVFVGGLDFVQRRSGTLRSAVSMGVLTFLLTHSIYVPASVLGYLALPAVVVRLDAVAGGPGVGFGPLAVLGPVAAAITDTVGAVPALMLAVALLVAGLRLFDRALDGVGTERLRERLFVEFERTWLSFGTGVGLTMLTTSVAFSLGVVVPLYNRGYVERDELVPYVLGANVGTLVDTLAVGVLLESPVGIAATLLLVAAATLLTLVALAVEDPYRRAVCGLDDRLLEDPVAFAAFVGSLLVVPTVLVVGPLVAA